MTEGCLYNTSMWSVSNFRAHRHKNRQIFAPLEYMQILLEIVTVLIFNYFLEIISSWPRSGEYSNLTKIPKFLEEFQFQSEDEITREEFLTLLADVCICLEEECDFLEYIEVGICSKYCAPSLIRTRIPNEFGKI